MSLEDGGNLSRQEIDTAPDAGRASAAMEPSAPVYDGVYVGEGPGDEPELAPPDGDESAPAAVTYDDAEVDNTRDIDYDPDGGLSPLAVASAPYTGVAGVAIGQAEEPAAIEPEGRRLPTQVPRSDSLLVHDAGAPAHEQAEAAGTAGGPPKEAVPALPERGHPGPAAAQEAGVTGQDDRSRMGGPTQAEAHDTDKGSDESGDGAESDGGAATSADGQTQPRLNDESDPAELTGNGGDAGGHDDPPAAQTPDDGGDEAGAFLMLVRRFYEHGAAGQDTELPATMTVHELTKLEHPRVLVDLPPDMRINQNEIDIDRAGIERSLEIAGFPNGWLRVVFIDPASGGIESASHPGGADGTGPQAMPATTVDAFDVPDMMRLDYPQRLMPDSTGRVLENRQGMTVTMNEPGFRHAVLRMSALFSRFGGGADAYDRAAAGILNELIKEALFQAAQRPRGETAVDPSDSRGVVAVMRDAINTGRLLRQRSNKRVLLVRHVPLPDIAEDE
jgi:hypothetical protein